MRVEVAVGAPADRVWAAVADVGQVHRRLLPGRVTGVRLEGDHRILAEAVRARVERGIEEMKHAIEAAC